jgi:hypothetical protein
VVVAALLAFGALAILSIGLPFIVVGLTLVVLAPFRSRPRIFFPSLAAVLGLVVGFSLAIPLECVEWFADGPGGSTSGGYCTNLLGARTEGPGAGTAALVGVALAIVSCLVALVLTGRSRHAPSALSPT